MPTGQEQAVAEPQAFEPPGRALLIGPRKLAKHCKQ